MSTWTLGVLVMTTCAISLVSCCTGTRAIPQPDALSRELLRTQQEYAGVVVPDPVGISPLEKEDAELQRRLGIVIDTWDDHTRGKHDARRALAHGRLTLLAFGPLNAYEKTYVEFLRKEFGIRLVGAKTLVADFHRRAYIYATTRRSPGISFTITSSWLLSNSSSALCDSTPPRNSTTTAHFSFLGVSMTIRISS